MQTHLHLLEQAISFSTQGTRLCYYWQGTTWLPQQELNSTDFHEMGKHQAYQFTSKWPPVYQSIVESPWFPPFSTSSGSFQKESTVKYSKSTNLRDGFQLPSLILSKAYIAAWASFAQRVRNNLNSCKNLRELQCKYWTDVSREGRSRKYWFYHFHKFPR